MRVTGDALLLDGRLGGSTTTTTLQVFQQNAALPMVAELMKIQSEQAEKKKRIAARDINHRVASILGQAQSVSTRQVSELKAMSLSSYHRPAAELALKWRSEADTALGGKLDSLGR